MVWTVRYRLSERRQASGRGHGFEELVYEIEADRSRISKNHLQGYAKFRKGALEEPKVAVHDLFSLMPDVPHPAGLSILHVSKLAKYTRF